MALNELNQGTLTSASQIPFFDVTNGQNRRASVAQLAEVLQSEMTASGAFVTKYAAPNAPGFIVDTTPELTGSSVYLKLTPSGTLASGQINLPLTAVDMQELLVSTRQTITALGVGGATVYGAPTTLAANGFFRLRYDGVEGTWSRVG